MATTSTRVAASTLCILLMCLSMAGFCSAVGGRGYDKAAKAERRLSIKTQSTQWSYRPGSQEDPEPVVSMYNDNVGPRQTRIKMGSQLPASAGEHGQFFPVIKMGNAGSTQGSHPLASAREPKPFLPQRMGRTRVRERKKLKASATELEALLPLKVGRTRVTQRKNLPATAEVPEQLPPAKTRKTRLKQRKDLPEAAREPEWAASPKSTKPRVRQRKNLPATAEVPEPAARLASDTTHAEQQRFPPAFAAEPESAAPANPITALEEEEAAPLVPWGRALPEGSECIKAYDGVEMEEAPSILTDDQLGVVESTVQFVGVGLKVPDKDRLFQVFCSRNISTVHVHSACHVSDEDFARHRKLMRDWACLVSGSCSHIEEETGSCTIRDIRSVVLEDLMDIIENSGIQAVTGPPYVQVAEELLEMVPTAKYVQTLMDPEAWVEHRMQRHIDWPMCTQDGSLPFSLFSCRDGSGACRRLPRVHISPTHAPLYPLIYNSHMAHIRSLIPAKQMHVGCAWDDNLKSLEDSLVALGHPKLDWYFWRHHDQWLKGHLSHMAPVPIEQRDGHVLPNFQ